MKEVGKIKKQMLCQAIGITEAPTEHLNDFKMKAFLSPLTWYNDEKGLFPNRSHKDSLHYSDLDVRLVSLRSNIKVPL